MPKSLPIFLALALVAALVAAGCGGSDDSASISKEEFIKQGDAICRKNDDRQYGKSLAYVKVKKNVAGLDIAETREKLTTAIAVPMVKQEAKELKALGIPDGDEEAVEALYAGIDEAVAEIEKDPVSIEGDGAKDPFADADNQAHKYGFKDCDEIS